MLHINKETLKPYANKLNHWLTKTGQLITSGWQGRVISLALFLLSIVVIITILISNWDVIKTYEWQIRPIWLLAVLIFWLIDLLSATWAWHLLVTHLANFKNFRRSAKICWRANLARRIPTPVWYIAGRAVLYEQEGVSKTTTSLLSSLELILFFISGLVTTLLVLPFWIIPDNAKNQINQFLLLALILPFTLILVHPKFLEKIWVRLRPDITLQPLKWHHTLTWLIYYILTWVIGALVLYSVMNFLYPVPPAYIVNIIGIWSLAGSVSLAGALSLSVFSLREISLTFLLSTLIPPPIALLVAILVRVVWILGEMLSVLMSLRL